MNNFDRILKDIYEIESYSKETLPESAALVKTEYNQSKSNEPTMSSREIAEISDKQHKDVLEAIRVMESAWVKVTGRNFSLSEYKDSTGRKLPCYELTRRECLYIGTKFSNEARAKLIVRWEELEMQNLKPKLPTYAEALRELADTIEEKALLEAQIEENRPKVLFADTVTNTDNAIEIGLFAKIIYNKHKIKMGRNRLFEWLRKNGYLMYKNVPYQIHIDNGLFKVIEKTYQVKDNSKITSKTMITGKGQIFIIEKILANIAA